MRYKRRFSILKVAEEAPRGGAEKLIYHHVGVHCMKEDGREIRSLGFWTGSEDLTTLRAKEAERALLLYISGGSDIEDVVPSGLVDTLIEGPFKPDEIREPDNEAKRRIGWALMDGITKHNAFKQAPEVVQTAMLELLQAGLESVGVTIDIEAGGYELKPEDRVQAALLWNRALEFLEQQAEQALEIRE